MKITFPDLGLIQPLLLALDKAGYVHPTPIQEQAIPPILQGRDVLGCAQTGTGKTAAFALPILQRLDAQGPARQRPNIRVLILTPTRELAIQIDEGFRDYGAFLHLKHTVIFGGVNQSAQVAALKRGIDVLVATPGRLLDLMQQGFISLSDLQVFVLDEADRMLDMGFIHDVKKVIAKIPAKRQTLFFSATMPAPIQQLADTILVNPVYIEVTPAATTAETIEQSLYYVDRDNKPALLFSLLREKLHHRALVFTRTKHGADKLVKILDKAGFTAAAIHGNKSQNQRQAALEAFKNNKIHVLVATDIAARGIDIELLEHVVNYEIPNIPESYVHRIGRGGRAGAKGFAYSFSDYEEMAYIKDIQKVIGMKIPVVEGHAYPMKNMVISEKPKQQQRPPRASRPGGNPAARKPAGRGGERRER